MLHMWTSPFLYVAWKRCGAIRCRKQMVLKEQLMQCRIELLLHVPIRIPDPGEIGKDIEWGAHPLPVFVGDNDPRFSCDQFGTQVVGMATQARLYSGVLRDG